MDTSPSSKHRLKRAKKANARVVAHLPFPQSVCASLKAFCMHASLSISLNFENNSRETSGSLVITYLFSHSQGKLNAAHCPAYRFRRATKDIRRAVAGTTQSHLAVRFARIYFSWLCDCFIFHKIDLHVDCHGEFHND